MRIFETIYEGSADELAAYEKAKNSSECTADVELNISEIEKKITDSVANDISKVIENSIEKTTKNKADALRDQILKLCQSQGVTVSEFESLIAKLEKALAKRKTEITDNVLISKDALLNNYYHVF